MRGECFKGSQDRLEALPTTFLCEAGVYLFHLR